MILALEASSSPGSMALVQGGEVRWVESFPTGSQHGGALFATLAAAWKHGDQITEIRLGLGPGSYAGVRMAIAAATGLALARALPLHGLPSVCTFAEQPRYCVIGDARRGGFYFTAVEQSRAVDGPRVVDAEGLQTLLAARPEWPVFTAEPLADFPKAQLAIPKAERLALLALEPTARALEPIYLREPHITQPRKG